ncbi:MAG TPA: hypothetical protein VGM11_04895 [Acidobacteriaceae bacterium]|jgi:hypothetical protein
MLQAAERPRRQEIRLRHGLGIGTGKYNAFGRAARTLWLVALGVPLALSAQMQPEGSTCTTQSAMSGDLRQSLADTALALASAVKANDSSRVQAMSAPDIASNFDASAYIIHQTSAAIGTDTLRVAQLYRLDATARKAGDTSEADFACLLSGSTGEVDFAIPGLPPGVYAFAIVDAEGDRPWMLPMLLEQQGSAWKMAGFYPHARTAAGHDGLWYWTTARADVKAGKKWLAWVLYGQADQLLRPANFITSTHLEQLRTERRNDAPGELSEGITAETPLVLKSKDGAEFRLTQLGSAAATDGKSLDLVLHYTADSNADTNAARTRNTAAAAALLNAHPELREGFSGVSVFSEVAGQSPFITEQSLADVH